jgi:hypothetical protein
VNVIPSSASVGPDLVRAIYQASIRSGWGEGGVYVRDGCSGAGDGDERNRSGGDPVPVALERYQVVIIELAGFAAHDRGRAGALRS